MSFSAFAQSHLLKGVATFSSFVFISVLLLNPDFYSKEDQYTVSAQFLANSYSPQTYVVDPSLSDLQKTSLDDSNKSPSLIAYTIKSSDTLSSIAKSYNVSIDQLKSLNNITDVSSLKPGAKIYITSQQGIVYTVKETTSLMVFANLYDIDESQLMKVNNQDDNMAPYRPGQAILIPSKNIAWAYDIGLLTKPEEPKKVILASNNTKSNKKISISSPRKVARAGGVFDNGSSSVITSWRENISENYGFSDGYCTEYAAAKADFAFGKDEDGKVYIGWRGDAKNRYTNAKKNGFFVSSTPSVGAIGVMSDGGDGNPAGHVVIVESVDWENQTILVSDMNYKGKGVATRRFMDMNKKMTQAVSGNQRFIGFIPKQKRPTKK